MDWIIDALVAAGGLIAYLLADDIVIDATGKHIHEHAFHWYRDMSDKICTWLHEHPKMRGQKLFLEVLNGVDNVASAVKRRLPVAVTTEGGAVIVREEDVPVEELEKLGIDLSGKTRKELTIKYEG